MSRPVGTGKPPGEHFESRQVKAHPSLWRRLDDAVPERGRRSEFIRKAIEEALWRKAAEEALDYYSTDPDVCDWLELDVTFIESDGEQPQAKGNSSHE